MCVLLVFPAIAWLSPLSPAQLTRLMVELCGVEEAVAHRLLTASGFGREEEYLFYLELYDALNSLSPRCISLAVKE
ncbi:polyprotein [Frankliniella fusca]|uniref:Polyprotein n=1 Tax=Frankliniella fusca TaxID=407009 RepID=A0AAE1GWE9_9NEOP|nr:polyprotein [Frankliniella fusca]